MDTTRTNRMAMVEKEEGKEMMTEKERLEQMNLIRIEPIFMEDAILGYYDEEEHHIYYNRKLDAPEYKVLKEFVIEHEKEHSRTEYQLQHLYIDCKAMITIWDIQGPRYITKQKTISGVFIEMLHEGAITAARIILLPTSMVLGALIKLTKEGIRWAKKSREEN